MPCSDTGKVKDDSQVVTVTDFDGDHDIDSSFNPFQDTISKENFNHFDSLGKDIRHSLLQPPKV